MKVDNCKKCVYCKRKKYSTYHTPKNYHPIAISHVYHFCELFYKKCLDVKKSECKKTLEENNNEKL